MMSDDRKPTFHIQDFSPDLRHRVVATATLRGTTVGCLMTEITERWFKEQERKSGRRRKPVADAVRA